MPKEYPLKNNDNPNVIKNLLNTSSPGIQFIPAIPTVRRKNATYPIGITGPSSILNYDIKYYSGKLTIK